MTKISPPHDLHSLHKEGWASKNWCFWTVVLEKNLESPLDSKIKPVSPKWNQSWISVGRIDAKAEAPILWPLDVKSWLIGKDWCWERLKAREGGNRGWDGWMVSLTHVYEFIQTIGDTEGQGSLSCCSPWGPKELDMTKWLNKKQQIPSKN